MKVRTIMTEKMFSIMLLFVVLILCPIVFAEEASTEDGIQRTDASICGSEDIFIYDAVNNRCMINFKKAMKKLQIFYEKNNENSLPEDEMAKHIYLEGEKIFRGIIIAVFLFMVCASICVISACIYCCRINYTDRKLKNHVKAVAKKLKRDYNSKKMAPKRAPLPAMSESCNVVVEPAGVYVA